MRGREREQMTTYGFYGLIPFVAAAVALWLSPWALPQSIALDLHRIALVYGAAIVAYLSGVGSGAHLSQKARAPSHLANILVVLAAFFAILPSGAFSIVIGAAWRHLIILLALLFLALRDVNAAADGRLPVWYGRLRSRLTFWASLSLALIIARLTMLGYY